MKKLLVLSLFASFAQAHCNTESTAQKQPNIVQLTEEEKVLRDRNLHGRFDEPLTEMLSIGCGINSADRSDSYDSNTFPDCPKVLAFLKAYAQAINAQDRKARALVQELYDNFEDRRIGVEQQKSHK